MASAPPNRPTTATGVQDSSSSSPPKIARAAKSKSKAAKAKAKACRGALVVGPAGSQLGVGPTCADSVHMKTIMYYHVVPPNQPRFESFIVKNQP